MDPIKAQKRTTNLKTLHGVVSAGYCAVVKFHNVALLVIGLGCGHYYTFFIYGGRFNQKWLWVFFLLGTIAILLAPILFSSDLYGYLLPANTNKEKPKYVTKYYYLVAKMVHIAAWH